MCEHKKLHFHCDVEEANSSSELCLIGISIYWAAEGTHDSPGQLERIGVTNSGAGIGTLLLAEKIEEKNDPTLERMPSWGSTSEISPESRK